jgi:hypothetical protein
MNSTKRVPSSVVQCDRSLIVQVVAWFCCPCTSAEKHPPAFREMTTPGLTTAGSLTMLLGCLASQPRRLLRVHAARSLVRYAVEIVLHPKSFANSREPVRTCAIGNL